jgi:hypothetical protein
LRRRIVPKTFDLKIRNNIIIQKYINHLKTRHRLMLKVKGQDVNQKYNKIFFNAD